MDWHPLEQGVFGDARKIKIAVVGIGREAGASFIAANLAYHLAKHVDGVTYMEAEDAQIAEALEGRRQVCYSLSLDRTLGLAAPLGLERLSKHGRSRPTDNKCSNECVRPDEYNCQPAPKGSTEHDRVSEHDCDHALGRDRPRDSDRNIKPGHNRAHASGRIREPGRKWSHAPDRNHESDRSPDHGRERSCAFDQNHESDRPTELDHKCERDRPTECSHLPEHDHGRAHAPDRNRDRDHGRTHAFEQNRGFDRPTELDHKCRPDRLPEHDRPSDAFSMRGTRGKFTDYFVLEKEGLPAGSRRNLYANVNWAVRAPLGAAPLEAAPSESRRDARSHAPFNEASTDTQQGAPLRQPRSRPAASEPCMLAAPQGIGRIPGRYMIVDNPRPESLWEADVVICVVDPLPSRIRSGLQQLEALRDNQIRFGKRFSLLLNLPSPVLWVLNKDNPQIGHRELERSLNIKFDFAVPLLFPEIFYKAEYSSVPIFQMLEAAGGRPHPSGISDMQHPRICPLAPKGADADGGSPRFHCGTGAGKAGGRGFWQTGRAPAGASAGGSSEQPRSGCAAACSEFGRLAKRVLKLLD